MEDTFKLKPVAINTLGLPPEATANLDAIAKREETTDLDTEREFREAANYLERLSEGIETTLETVRPIPAPSEGTTVFGITYANAKLGNQIFQYSITQGNGGRFQPSAGDVISSFDVSDRRVEYHYCTHTNPTLFAGGIGDIVKLASDGEKVFALADELMGDEASDYVAVHLAESDSAMFGVLGEFEPLKIDSPEFEGPEGESRLDNLLLEDLTIIDDRVYGIYWDLSTHAYLELPLTVDESVYAVGGL